jgi:hypothetical protein
MAAQNNQLHREDVRLRLQKQTPPRQAIPLLSRNEQRSRMLQNLENLLHEGILSIQNFTDNENTALTNDDLACLSEDRSGE